MKQKWQKSQVTKGILIIAAHVAVILMVVCMWWAANYPQLLSEITSRKPSKVYEDSQTFRQHVMDNSMQVIFGLETKNLFETDGSLDKDKIVDIEEYYNSGTISGKDISGLSYRLGDILQWKKEYNSGVYKYDTNINEAESREYRTASASGKSFENNEPIVCKRSDGTYHYYNTSEFREKIKTGELQFVVANEKEGLSASQILDELDSGNASAMDTFMGIQDAEGRMIYVDCWKYDGSWVEEKYQPVSGQSVMELVNDNPNWNGRLNDAYSMISSVLDMINSRYSDYQTLQKGFDEGDTNYDYLYVDGMNRRVYTNKAEYSAYADVEKNLGKMKQSGKYVIVKPRLADFDTNIEGIEASEWRGEVQYSALSEDSFVFACSVDTNYPIHDLYYSELQTYNQYSSVMRGVMAAFIIAAVVLGVCVIWLVAIAGRTNTDEELHLCWFDRWKTELAALIVIVGWFAVCYLVLGVIGWNFGSAWIITGCVLAGLAIYTCAMFLIGLLSLVRRIKARTVWKNSLFRSICHFVKITIQHLNCVFKTIIFYGLFVIVHWLTVLASGGADMFWILIMLVVEAVVFVILIYDAIGKDKLKNGIDRIAHGEVDYKVPTVGLHGEHRGIAEAINTIGSGLDAAVEESMKSERLKTDLITNVSHDIKTPLTSIINYVDLLKKENFEDPKIQRYLEILENKAQRLKTLTEDVVEASKVSSGNITLEYMNINLVELVQQTSGEFEEKFSARNLKEVLTLPEGDAIIRADGRRVWRVLENIYNNAAKYAMEGTRIYADLKADDTRVIFSLKNVSEQSLNISADELTERFIRGDISRSTEGSGLGLSIAKTLTQMQGGKFELYLDGDLFKVTVEFPRIEN